MRWLKIGCNYRIPCIFEAAPEKFLDTCGEARVFKVSTWISIQVILDPSQKIYVIVWWLFKNLTWIWIQVILDIYIYMAALEMAVHNVELEKVAWTTESASNHIFSFVFSLLVSYLVSDIFFLPFSLYLSVFTYTFRENADELIQ